MQTRGPVAAGCIGDTNKGMQARLLLVHSPLVGCGSWEHIADVLAGDGYAVTVPDLAGIAGTGPPYHLRQARLIADSAAGQPATLIGHSRAGPLLATAGTMLGQGVRGYVFVDARLPSPGRSWMETVPPGLAARLRDMADPQGWPNAPGGYLQLSKAYEDDAARAGELGWPVRQQLSHHLALLTEPGQVAREVRELIGQP
jgi:pimeloyl-ACP methyl ester carboxylesterase